MGCSEEVINNTQSFTSCGRRLYSSAHVINYVSCEYNTVVLHEPSTMCLKQVTTMRMFKALLKQKKIQCWLSHHNASASACGGGGGRDRGDFRPHILASFLIGGFQALKSSSWRLASGYCSYIIPDIHIILFSRFVHTETMTISLITFYFDGKKKVCTHM